jgi:hypothetical protein
MGYDDFLAKISNVNECEAYVKNDVVRIVDGGETQSFAPGKCDKNNLRLKIKPRTHLQRDFYANKTAWCHSASVRKNQCPDMSGDPLIITAQQAS